MMGKPLKDTGMQDEGAKKSACQGMNRATSTRQCLRHGRELRDLSLQVKKFPAELPLAPSLAGDTSTSATSITCNGRAIPLLHRGGCHSFVT